MPRISRDGVSLAYSTAGSGKPALVLIHGWTCDRGFFAPQVEAFSPRHRILTADLKGHGESDKPDEDYTISGFADDVAWMAKELGLVRYVVIGHSMGGMVAQEMAARQADAVSAVVRIDSGPLRMDQAGARLWDERVAGLSDPQRHMETRRRMVEGMFEQYDDPARKASIAETMLGAPRHVALASLRAIASWDREAAVRKCKVPVLNIETRRSLDPAWAELMPRAFHGRTTGAGHFAQVEAPDQVNAMLSRFLEIAVHGE